MKFLTRLAKLSDLNLVRSSWLRSYRRDQPRMSNEDYFEYQHNRIERLLTGSQVLIAHLEDAPDVIIGWLCCEPAVLHFAWTLLDFQRMGVLKTLLAAADFAPGQRVSCSHLTRDFIRAIPNHRYIPHLLDRT